MLNNNNNIGKTHCYLQDIPTGYNTYYILWVYPVDHVTHRICSLQDIVDLSRPTFCPQDIPTGLTWLPTGYKMLPTGHHPQE